jgi:hypothetical protein
MEKSPDLRLVQVRPIHADEAARWVECVQQHHYLGYRGIAGKAVRYVATLEGQWVALLAWGSAAFRCRARDQYIGWDEQTREKRLHLVVNNVRFLMLPGVEVKNLASKVLSLNLKRLAGDYQRIHGYPVVLAETFVDIARFRGTCYRAANWQCVGQSLGYAKHGNSWRYHGQPKAVFVYPLRPDGCGLLRGTFLPADFSAFKGGKEGGMELLMEFPIEGLMEQIHQVQDPRKRRGVRHPCAVIIGIAVCAVICGARGYTAIADWAKGLREEDLRRFGNRRDKPPSEPTIRRMLQTIDAQAFDERIGAWMQTRRPLQGKGVAVDGKTLRGSRDGEKTGVHLLSAVIHKEGLIVAQQPVDAKTNEITQVEPLVKGLDLRGAVVTADALLTQKAFASHLVEEKGADYVFTVKGNQPSLLEDLKLMEFEKKTAITPPSTRPMDDSSDGASGSAAS